MYSNKVGLTGAIGVRWLANCGGIRSPVSGICTTAPLKMTESRFKIYTKTGDEGTSSLYNGQRLPKDDAHFHALGDVDELNSAIGVAREFCSSHSGIIGQLEILQSRLLDVGSAVATPANKSSEAKLKRVQFDATATDKLEGWIDELDAQLPPLKNFILPSGGQGAAFLHMARSICRRAERSVVLLWREESTDPEVTKFLNRMSDYLFTAARYVALKDGQPETTYKKGAASASDV